MRNRVILSEAKDLDKMQVSAMVVAEDVLSLRNTMFILGLAQQLNGFSMNRNRQSLLMTFFCQPLCPHFGHFR